MVSLAQQGEQQRADGGHAGAEHTVATPCSMVLILVSSAVTVGVDLAGVGIAGALALEHVGKVLRILVPVGGGRVDRLLQDPCSTPPCRSEWTMEVVKPRISDAGWRMEIGL